MPPRFEVMPLVGLLALAALPVQAQLQAEAAVEGSGAPATLAAVPAARIVPRVSLTETATSNVNLTTAGQSDLVTRLSPGVYASRRGGRVQGFVDYSFSGVAYARGSRSSELLNALRANGTAEVVEKRGFIDVSASISQQSINPLGAQSIDPQLGRGNQTEVRTLELSPRLQGQLGAGVEWTARAAHASSTSTASSASDSATSSAQVSIGNGSQPTRLGWSLQASRNQRSFDLGRTTEEDTLRGVLDYRFGPELSVGLIGGYESTDIASLSKEGRATHGLRLNWLPSARTRLSAEAQRRFFGNAYNVSFSHRLARASLSYSATRSLSTGVGQPLRVSQGTWYDLLFQQFAPLEADLNERDRLVREFLRNRNLDPDAAALPSFLSSGVTLQQSQQLSLAWVGVRDTLTLAVQQSNSRRVDDVLAVSDAFATNANIRQRGYSLTLAHRLTPTSNVSLGLTQTRSTGSGSVSTSLRSATVQWGSTLGPRSSFSLLGRRAHFTSSTQPYDESALIGTFGMTF